MKHQSKRSLGDIPGLELHLSPALVKWIGLVCLCFGSLSASLIQQGILGGTPLEQLGESPALTAWANAAVVCTAISYLAIPIYARLVYEGVRRTSNFRRYLLRLAALALLAEIPYDLVWTGAAIDWSTQNPVWGIAIAAVMARLDETRAQPGTRGSVLQCLTMLMAAAWALVFRSQFGLLTVLLTAVLELFSGKRGAASLAGGFLCCLQLPAPLGMLVSYWYDGAKGKPAKYRFYLLYLAQLLLFSLHVIF